MTPPRNNRPARFEGDGNDTYAVLTWRGMDTSTLKKHWFADPTETLATAVEYLKRGYQVRLSDRTVAHYAELEHEAAGQPRPRLVEGGAS